MKRTAPLKLALIRWRILFHMTFIGYFRMIRI